MSPRPQAVVVFDGVCNLCNYAVMFIIRRDVNGRYRFASLQSEAGQSLLRQYGLPSEHFDSVVLIEGNRCYTQSTAALRIARGLGGLWPMLYLLIALPRPWRNALYNWVARNRYRWFGQPDQCLMPAPELRERFLD